MTDVTARLPAALSSRLASTSSQIGARGGRAIDYMIAGIPFLSAADSQNPFVIETADMRKEQFDSEAEPGEQSLQGWWLRSQDSWHHGAGAKFQESRTNTNPSARFFESRGVDVWTEGELRLLRRMTQSTAPTSQASCLYEADGFLYMAVGSSIRRTTAGNASATTELAAITGDETFSDITVGKESWYAVSDSGKVYTEPVSGSATKMLFLTNSDANRYTPPRLAWAKHRLWATSGRRVYVVDTTLDTNGSVDPLYSHPTTDWSYTDIAEGPNCVYVSGWSDAESSIQKITLENDGTIPTLSAGITTAIMPPGERVQRIAVLAGAWVAIGTNRGLRLGAIDQNGDIQYGPVFVKPEGAVACKAITAWDRFFYVSWQTDDSKAVVYRVDASVQPDEDGAFAYARDVEADSAGYFSDLAVVGEGRVVGAFSAGTYPVQAPDFYWYQHATELVPEGTITFGRIRYRTTEPKIFKYVSVDVEPLAGSIAMDAVLNNGSLARFALLNQQGRAEFEQASIPPNVGPQRSMGLRFTIARSSDPSQGPVLHSYSVKALPAVKPQRLIQLPLSCYDREMWVSGQEYGRDGWARDRLAALQTLEDSGDLVIWQDMSQEDLTGRQVKIDKVSFRQASPPNAKLQGRNYGGVVTLLLRTMD